MIAPKNTMHRPTKYSSFPTRKLHAINRRNKAAGEVPMPQLYRDIDAGYRYFLARRTHAMALGIRLTDLPK
jgi:hypothetical protein